MSSSQSAPVSKRFTFRSDIVRDFPDPLNFHKGAEKYNIKHCVMYAYAYSVQAGISKKPNARHDTKIDRGVYAEVAESLRDASLPWYHLKGRGITILVDNFKHNEDKGTVSIDVLEDQGIVDEENSNEILQGIPDGGHTYEVILDAIRKAECPPTQCVFIHLVSGVPNKMIPGIARGLNKGIGVQEKSLFNLQKYFDWVKEAIKGEPYENAIRYEEGEEGKSFDIRDLAAVCEVFNIGLYPTDIEGEEVAHPRKAYDSKAKCLASFCDGPIERPEGKKETYKKLSPILKEILFLHDYVKMKSKIEINENGMKAKKGEGTGLAGAHEGVFEKLDKGEEYLPFIQLSDSVTMHEAMTLPILAALRQLLKVNKDGNCAWRLGSFDKTIVFYDSIAWEMAKMVVKTSESQSNSPDLTLKDERIWEKAYSIVQVQMLKKGIK